MSKCVQCILMPDTVHKHWNADKFKVWPTNSWVWLVLPSVYWALIAPCRYVVTICCPRGEYGQNCHRGVPKGTTKIWFVRKNRRIEDGFLNCSSLGEQTDFDLKTFCQFYICLSQWEGSDAVAWPRYHLQKLFLESSESELFFCLLCNILKASRSWGCDITFPRGLWEPISMYWMYAYVCMYIPHKNISVQLI